MKRDKESKHLLYSPTDLNNFVACKYYIKNDFIADEQNLKKKEKSADLNLRIQYGKEHEKKHLNIFSKKFKKSITINHKQSDEKRYHETLQALKDGYDFIYKAFFIDKNLRGELDFLLKEKKKSNLGDYSYEVYDTKITKNLKPKHVLQITGYSYLLSKSQGLMPTQMHLIDGGDLITTFKVNEFIDYFLYTQNNFEKFVPTLKEKQLYPEKCSFCNICDWQDECEKIWIKDNYINQVCGIRSSQVVKLKKENIKTIKDLAGSRSDSIKSKINPATKIKLIKQAQLHEEKRKTGKSKFEFYESEKNKGFYKMPKPNEGDLFYDIEGFPQPDKRPYEYLHGLYFTKKKEFKYFVVNDYSKEEEKKIFIKLIEYLEKHFNKYPNAYLYHYNDYEKRALRELASDYSSVFQKGYNFVDRLLRQEKFVDLYRVVSQCLQTSEKDLSLKTIEKFYRKERSAEVKTADESIRLFDSWSSSKNEKFIKDIIAYNEEDCISTSDLRNFLLENRPDIKWFAQTEEQNLINAEVKDFEVRETSVLLNLESKKNKSNLGIVENLVDLVGFHRREDKSKYWAKFDRFEKTASELIDDPECIADAIFIESQEIEESGNTLFVYQFNEQNFKLKEGDPAHDIFTDDSYGEIKKITELSEDENYVEFEMTKKRLSTVGQPPKNFSFGPGRIVDTTVIATALNRFINDFSQSNSTKYKAGENILKKNYPNLKGVKPGNVIIDNNKDVVEESIKAVKKLEESYMVIQGPPGTGKTYTSAKIILSLLKDKKRVGITSNSHKAINNLLEKIEELAVKEKFTFSGMKKFSKKEDKLNGKIIKDISGRLKSFPEEYLLHAGTAWLFSDPRYDLKMDYLFVDEAGQVSLANIIAMSTSCKNLILVGDQMQLSQPIQGIHAGNAGKSGLDFLMESFDTIPESRGIFLGETRRLNEKICSYISSSFYDSRLKSNPITKTRSVSLELKDIDDEGIFYLPIDHSDCTQRSDEEANLIKKYYSKILGKKAKEENQEKEIGIKDIMTVAPFNMQVNNLKKIINIKNSKIGTIDKFQGQEAKVVFISMTSSDPENLPRHKEFFFSRNRLNVAMSRAQCVVVIMFNPNLLLTNCQKINEMRLVNNFCKLLKYKVREIV